jgi:hypothetical protein
MLTAKSVLFTNGETLTANNDNKSARPWGRAQGTLGLLLVEGEFD